MGSHSVLFSSHVAATRSSLPGRATHPLHPAHQLTRHPHCASSHLAPAPSDLESAKLAGQGAVRAAGFCHTTAGAGTPRSRRIIQLLEDARQRAVAAAAFQTAGELARHMCGQLAVEAGAATGAERAAAMERVEAALQQADASLAGVKPWLPGMLYKRMAARNKEVSAHGWKYCCCIAAGCACSRAGH